MSELPALRPPDEEPRPEGEARAGRAAGRRAGACSGSLRGSPRATRCSRCSRGEGVGPSPSSWRSSAATSPVACSNAPSGTEDAGVERGRCVVPVPGAFELPLAAIALAKTRPVRLHRRARVCDPRRDPALRVRRRRGGEQASARSDRDRRPGLLRRADDGFGRAGPRSPDRPGRRRRPERAPREWPTSSRRSVRRPR